ncbi:DUF6415 family natural product biosynthesis protein [Streptomyces sp. NPDC004629]|uniref:DUF6415 family natural product biosynthesis protein n=1 Tax=Streptomyces sp. NPDC004629 TaxID=3364705 RepID=UPI0036B22B1C
MKATARPPAVAGQDRTPPDVATMRATAALLLGPDDSPDVLPPAPADVDTLIAALRSHLELITPQVEEAAGKLAKESTPRYCALACVGEARGKLSARPGPGAYGTVAYARRLARVLEALCAHHETLGEV